MKSKYILPIFGVLAAASLTGCYEMDSNPMNQYITESSKAEAAEQNPEIAQAGVTGITAVFSTYMQVLSTSREYHSDFGFPAIMLSMDSRGVDMVGANTGYNWFATPEEMADARPNSTTPLLVWNNCYRQIFSANSVLSTIAADTEDPTLKFYRAQAMAMRANDYLILAQTFQFTYKGNEQKPCVMLVTEENASSYAVDGAARSTVEQIYTQIDKDLTEAIKLLTEAQGAGVTADKLLSAKPKRMVSLAAAYGLRARANLLMNKWADAASDAKNAIDNFNGAPLSIAEAGKPGFGSIDAKNWMWGIAIAPTDRVVTSGIVNFPSHMGSFNYGYASVGAWRLINKQLFESIPESDVRRGWFLDADGQSANLTEAQQVYCDENKMPAYAQVKFAPYQDILGNSENACDIPLMRIEEMYYILAEAQAMGGNPGEGATTLNQFVNTYRDATFTASGSAEDIQEACFQQRRLELFGEGLIYYDYMRLNKPFNRIGGGFPVAFVYNVPAGSDVLILPLPETEVNGNKKFTAADNNPSASTPTPVKDTVEPIIE